jgi:hypothetical protein
MKIASPLAYLRPAVIALFTGRKFRVRLIILKYPLSLFTRISFSSVESVEPLLTIITSNS